MKELKYIITKDFKHFKSDWLHHSTIARDNGYNERDIIEAGLFLEGKIYILECYNQKHIIKRQTHYIGNALNEYQDLRLKQWLSGRELESSLYYRKKAIARLPEGD
jgi:hypothetical protein